MNTNKCTHKRRHSRSHTHKQRGGASGWRNIKYGEPKFANTSTSTTSASALAHKMFIGVPLRITDKLVNYLEDIVGLDSSQSTEQLTKEWRAKAGVLSTVAKDPIIIKNVTDTLRESSDILVKTVNEAGPKLTSAGSNVIQAIPLYGNVVSILRAVAEGSDAGAKLASRMVEAGILGLDSVNRIKAGAKRLHQLASVGDVVDRAGQSLVNRGIHATTDIVDTNIHHGLDALDKSASLRMKNVQVGGSAGGGSTARGRTQQSIQRFL